MNIVELTKPLSLNSITGLSLIILLLPLVSFFLILFFGKRFTAYAAWGSTVVMALGTALSIFLFTEVWGNNLFHSRLTWFSLPAGIFNYEFTAGLLIDDLAVFMLLVVMLIAWLVHLFSITYMKGDPGYSRFFAFLGLFTFAMLGIVVADNLLILFMFWELVGLSSYLLIGFWYKKEAAASAGKKAFLVNRVGDLGFIVALLVLWTQFATFDLEALKALMANSTITEGNWMSVFQYDGITLKNVMDDKWLTIAGIGLFCGVIGKSAQFPLQVWLPDAMEGPTPVSALIHAATMVAAGVFLLARVFVLLNVEVLTVIAFVGAITAFMGAFAAFAQNDIKKVLAFSTISQLGYMVMGMGVGAYDTALFHLLTHAFFKACLFLSAGAIIYSLHRLESDLARQGRHVNFDVQDMRFMGGLRKKMPLTFTAFIISALALSGLPLFSGFLSKDAILTGAWAWANVMSGEGAFWYYLVPDLGFITAFMTAMYMGRQVLLVFFGSFRLEQLSEKASGAFQLVKEAPVTMLIPLGVLSLFSFAFVFSINPFTSASSWFLKVITVPELVAPDQYTYDFSSVSRILMLQEYSELHTMASGLSIILALGGLGLAYKFYNPQSKFATNYLVQKEPSGRLARWSRNNWYLDQFYEKTVLRASAALTKVSARIDSKVIDPVVNFMGVFNVILAHIIGWIDRKIIDGLVNFIAYLSGLTGSITRSFQGGYIQKYFIWTLLGVIIVMAWIII